MAAPGGRRFRRAALAGGVGEELAGARWWRRIDLPACVLLCAAGALVLPAAVLSGGHGAVEIWGAATFFLVCAGSAVFLPAAFLETFWWGRARVRHRLQDFAVRNALAYCPAPDTVRPAAHIFAYGQRRRLRDHLTVSGPYGFRVFNYDCDPAPDDAELPLHQWGCAVFTLRESFPRTLLTRGKRGLAEPPRGLRKAEPVPGPDGTRMIGEDPDHALLRCLLDCGIVATAGHGRAGMAIEVVGNELFLLAERPLPLRSPRLWRRLAAAADCLAPFLATEAGTDRLPVPAAGA
ncbi:hypothetical protein DSC45_31825 [Streptomyces sp. YIM 130001]|uniref:hypothetical protein n=1 Tax=Streptomyces sp. YIM 130001 TaxID=2259644 RepID=UPI000E65A2C7|nr:hypothetical protein [Streptomyces sp. YIM 130001]RII09279.1 hypothetical protein DSC45_31825 [Streptomyces sp. YIM 130001]